MRYLVLSDLHANQVALEAVLRHAKLQRFEQVIFLGDAVGYYTEADDTIRLLRTLDVAVAILGNHDALLLELRDKPPKEVSFSDVVTYVLSEHLVDLSSESLLFLEGLKPQVSFPSWEATHGALHKPWAYIDTTAQAQLSAALMQTNVCLVGHSHVPAAYAFLQGKENLTRTIRFQKDCNIYRIPPNVKVILNPGSVGQPRDRIPKASYAVFDDDLRTFEVFRVEFDIRKVQQQVRYRNYPEVLARRLERGA